ncbi:hypothetical protein HDU87_001595 [Geranomyces variabilis]|uniref:SH3 domain-containing protein n=1 Tax=Geranomyces variabilis TaxID=109894 RepID=A0AAD5TN76_9FUNG|nr:hypothetical protein HDU87_001595 [Geranomyces variabilis]
MSTTTTTSASPASSTTLGTMVLIAACSAAGTIAVVLFLCWACTCTSSRIRARRHKRRLLEGGMEKDDSMDAVQPQISRYDARDSCGDTAGMEQVVVVPHEKEKEQSADDLDGEVNRFKTDELPNIPPQTSGDDDDRRSNDVLKPQTEITIPTPAATRHHIPEIAPAQVFNDPNDFITPRPSLDEQGNNVPDTPVSAISEATIRANPPRQLKTCSLFSAITPLPPFTTSPSHGPDIGSGGGDDDGGTASGAGAGFFEHDSTAANATDSDDGPDPPTRRASLAPSFASSNISALVAMYQTTLASKPNSPHASIGEISSPTNVRAAYPHEPVFSDEIDVRPGDQMLVEQVFQDGWAFGWNVRVGARGMFPLTTLSFDESALRS